MDSAAKSSIALGIDIGSDKCVVAFVDKKGVVDVLQNEASKRETPVVVHFDKRQRLFGSAGAARANMDPNSTISQLKRLIGRRFDEPSIQKEFSLHSGETSDNNGKVPKGKGPIVVGPKGEVMVNVRYLGKDMEITAVEMLGMFLCYLTRMIKKTSDLIISDCVIGIPSYFTDQQRRDYLLAAEVAGLNPLRLFHDGAATALDYGLHRNLPHGEATNVVFVDIGHGDTQVTVVRFCFGTATVLAHSFDRDLGGRDFDDVIFESFAQKFKQKYQLNVRENPKATLRLRTACEKAKKVLSSNSEAQINIECLVGDNDLAGVITRTEFEKLSSGLLDRIKAACERALTDADLIKQDIHSVELVGSGSRIPKISNVLSNFFGREMSRTLNGSECIANGCALQCAMLNRSPEASIFGVLDRMPFSIIGSPACKNSSISPNIISKGSFLLTPRMFRLHPSESVTISYANSEDLPCGVSQCITCYKVASENANEKYDLELKVQFDIHGIINLQPIKEALKQTEPFSSEKARPYSDSPVVGSGLSQGPEEQSQEIQNEGDKFPASAVISGGIIPCDADIKNALYNARNLEMKLMAQDHASERAKNCRNDLEAYLYQKRGELSLGLGNLASESCRDLLFHKLRMTENWLNESSTEEPEETYKEKMHELNLDLEKLLEEHNENKKRNDFVIHETGKLHDFELMYKGYLGEVDVGSLNDKQQEIMSFLSRDGVIPKENYDTESRELDALLNQIASRCREAESRSRPDSALTRAYNVTCQNIQKATSLLHWNSSASQTSNDHKGLVHGIHLDPCQKDISSGEACPTDGKQNLPSAPSSVASDFSAVYQQLSGTLPQAVDATSSSAASGENSSPDVEMPDVNGTVIASESSTLNCQTSATAYKNVLLDGTSSMPPLNPRIDNQNFRGSSNRTQERGTEQIRASMIKKGDVIIIEDHPCEVRQLTNFHGYKQLCKIVGTGIFNGVKREKTVPLSQLIDRFHVTDCRLRKFENGVAIFEADTGNARFEQKFSTEQISQINAESARGNKLHAFRFFWRGVERFYLSYVRVK